MCRLIMSSKIYRTKPALTRSDTGSSPRSDTISISCFGSARRVGKSGLKVLRITKLCWTRSVTGRPPKTRFCLVTFNYDTLLEDALTTVGVDLSSLSSYVKGPDKVVKPLGSVNWAREVSSQIDAETNNVFEIPNKLIDRAAELEISQSYEIVWDYPIGKSGNRTLFPALAIPVETKPGYECPQDQLDVLEKCLPKMTKLLVIGWHATENRFLKSLGENIGHETRVMVVSSNAERAREVTSRMKAEGLASGQFMFARSGFSNFVGQREADEFLRT